MNDVAPIIPAGQLSMSSREIAELCDKRHDHVMTDIRKMLVELGINAPEFSGTYLAGRGNQYECFNLPKRETLILVSGYNLSMRAKIIDRWQELEAQAATPAAAIALDDPAALRAALLGYTDKVIELEAAKSELEHQVEVITPKAEIYDKYLNAEGLMSLQDLGRALGQGPNKFIDHLKGKWLFESRGQLLPLARYGEDGIGIFAVKSGIFGDKVRRRTMATPKAVLYFARKIEAEQRKAAA